MKPPREITLAILDTALERVESDHAQHSPDEHPAGHHHAHGPPRNPAEEPPASQDPKQLTKAGFFPEKRGKFHGGLERSNRVIRGIPMYPGRGGGNRI